MGAILGHVAAEGRRICAAYARDIGLAFQIADDLLDMKAMRRRPARRCARMTSRASRPSSRCWAGTRARTGRGAGRPGDRPSCRTWQGGGSAARDRPLYRREGSANGHCTERERIGVYPGTFDPITLGHADIIRRGAKLVDRLIIGVTTNPSKNPMFTPDERIAMVEREVAQARARQCRGRRLQRAADEIRRTAGRQRDHSRPARRGRFRIRIPDGGHEPAAQRSIETVFLMADVSLQPIASKLVKEIALFGGDISQLRQPRGARRRDRAGCATRPAGRLLRRIIAAMRLSFIEPTVRQRYTRQRP